MRHPMRTMTLDGVEVNAEAPEIISASRSTDMPAFHADVLQAAWERGAIEWKNPFNAHQRKIISLSHRPSIVLWTKNAAPALPFLARLSHEDIPFYIQHTVNDMPEFEPDVPELAGRIDTVLAIAEKHGGDAVVWRCDPLVLCDRIPAEEHLRRMAAIHEKIGRAIDTLVVSFVDISRYKRVAARLASADPSAREWTTEEMHDFLGRLRGLIPARIAIATCAEDVAVAGVGKSACIDKTRLIRRGMRQTLLCAMPEKDKGQRPLCGCAPSRDIGTYGTCSHGCIYCYAR